MAVLIDDRGKPLSKDLKVWLEQSGDEVRLKYREYNLLRFRQNADGKLVVLRVAGLKDVAELATTFDGAMEVDE